MLPDPALACLSAVDLVEVVEKMGAFPPQLQYLLFPMLFKPNGGLRAVLLSASLPRLWQRLRREHFTQFLRVTMRPYWAQAKCRSLEGVVWLQTVRAEAAGAAGGHSAFFMLDARSFYESFNLEKLRLRLLDLGAPPVLVKVSYNLWQCVSPSPACHSRAPRGRNL